MSFGVADYAASTRARTTVIGGVHRDSGVLTDKDADGSRQYFWTDPWHAAQTRMMVACRAYGLRPIDGPFGDFSDPEGYLAAANRAAVLGYEGKWAIHPIADRTGEPGVHAIGRRSDQGPAHRRGHGAGREGGQGRSVAGWPPDRHCQHPHGPIPARQGANGRLSLMQGDIVD